MDIRVIGVAGFLGVLATGGGVYLSLTGNQNLTSISELFKKERGLKLMEKDNDSKWNEAWERYRNDHKNTGTNNYKDIDKWGISNWKEKRSGNEAFEEFKKECERRSKVEVKDVSQQEYKDVKKYCSRPKKVFELLSEDKTKTLLNKDGDSEKWEVAWNQYKKDHVASTSENTITYITPDKWGMQGWSASHSLAIPQGYKARCEEKWNSHIDPEKLTKDETFKQVFFWCTK